MGDDEFPRSNAAKELVGSLVPPAEQAFGLETIDGKADTVDEAVRQIKACRDALLTAGFLSAAGKVVWWRDVSFLTDGVVGRSEGVKEQLKSLVEAIQGLTPDGNRLVVTAAAVDKRSAFFKVFKDRHRVQEFALPEKAYQFEQYARESAQAALRERGLRVPDGVLQAFVQRAGNDARQLAAEAEKLDIYLGARRDVTEADVQVIVCAGAAAGMWDFLDAVSERSAAKAFPALRDLLASKESGVGIVTMLASRLRDVALYREALDRGWVRLRTGGRDEAVWGPVPPEVEEAFASGMKRDPRKAHPFSMMKLCKQAGKFTAAQMTQAMKAVAETHEKLVSSRLSERYLLDLMLVRILGVDRR